MINKSPTKIEKTNSNHHSAEYLS